MTQNAPPGPQQDGGSQSAWIRLAHGLLKAHYYQAERDCAEQRQQQQGHAPAKQVGYQSAQRRAQAGNHPETRQALAHGPRTGLWRVQVTNQGTRAHHRRPHCCSLHDAPQDKQLHR
ncbi:hypothetical protein SDC9_193732 [bioreactor metagenome]|uniref:Uncharacterized protein n=1 Tax=bioreactor metagenome TaxID=1076179 RepID=A0A645I6Y1_9ZZZZ